MRTRRFKALNGAKGKYARVVNKIAIYDDNDNQIDCCIIQKDKDGMEFYYPTNPHNELGLFTNRPKDALECIKNGFGDAICVETLLGFKSEHVVRYIDRDFGESIRKKSIEGWKDPKFAYGIKFIFLNSFSEGRFVCKDNAVLTNTWYSDKILTFETESEAKAFIEETNNKISEYYKEYLNLERSDDREYDYQNIVKPFFNKIEGGGTFIDSLYTRALMCLNDIENKKNNSPGYKLEIAQVFII